MGDPTCKAAAPRGGGAGVFVDLSGERARLLRRGVTLLAAGAVLILTALTAGFSGLVPPPPWQLRGPQSADLPAGNPGGAAESMGGASRAQSPLEGGAQAGVGDGPTSVLNDSEHSPNSEQSSPRRWALGGQRRDVLAAPSGLSAPPPEARPPDTDHRPPLSSSAVLAESTAGQPPESQEEAEGGSGDARDASAGAPQGDRAPRNAASSRAREDRRERGASGQPAGPNSSRDPR